MSTLDDHEFITWSVQTIKGVDLRQTSFACPEQYEAYLGDKQIGYLRLRHGWFYAAYPDVGGEHVYESNTIGDGAFEDSERAQHLEAAVVALLERHALALGEPL